MLGWIIKCHLLNFFPSVKYEQFDMPRHKNSTYITLRQELEKM
jgi:hypothetical protein